MSPRTLRSRSCSGGWVGARVAPARHVGSQEMGACASASWWGRWPSTWPAVLERPGAVWRSLRSQSAGEGCRRHDRRDDGGARGRAGGRACCSGAGTRARRRRGSLRQHRGGGGCRPLGRWSLRGAGGRVVHGGCSEWSGVCVSVLVGRLPSTWPVVLERTGGRVVVHAACSERGGVCVSMFGGDIAVRHGRRILRDGRLGWSSPSTREVSEERWRVRQRRGGGVAIHDDVLIVRGGVCVSSVVGRLPSCTTDRA
jgi:hypothetical protein